MNKKYLIIKDLELPKEYAEEYLKEGWHIEEDFGLMVQLGLYVDDYNIFIENLKNDLAYVWDNDELDYNNYEEFEKSRIEFLKEYKCLEFVNGYSYYIK